MIVERLRPDLELLREEYVLVQAWKKTATYIRYHNWFSDTLALDRAAVNLPRFLDELRERLNSPESWQSDPLRIVPAPKSQRWRVDPRSRSWEPIEKGTAARLRPLAHVSLADQVVATAIMLCLADRVETRQGDPRSPTGHEQSRRRVVSYGNRLFCDAIDGELRHRWGSSKLYRAYYQDYRTFLARPEEVADALLTTNGKRVFVVHADLRQFYDRVRPDSLARAMEALRQEEGERSFFHFAQSVLDWCWDSRDEREVGIYAQQAELGDFTRVALPQGLVAAGFFANVVLLAFDDRLRQIIGTELAEGVLVADACRYVDDLRITLEVSPQLGLTSESISTSVSSWLADLLKREAIGLELSAEKTKVAAFGGDERPLVRQSARMNRIQSAVSGGFDAIGGEEILDAIQGLMRAQEALSVADESGWRLSPVPDVRDDTVARFGAARFRTTFRSIRPLLEDDGRADEVDAASRAGSPVDRVRVARTRHELDEDARAFALGLIQRWVQDPSNVRLLRIGLDLWPDVEVLREVLGLLRPFTERGGRRNAPRKVACYCLSEVLRAGATETGLVSDAESMPSGIDLPAYRAVLLDEAARLVTPPAARIPWYLRQQALLFIAAFAPASAPVVWTGTGAETRHYWELIRFLRGEGDRLRSADFATLAVLARRAFVNRQRAIELAQPALNPSRRRQIAERDPSFTLELMEAEAERRLFDDLPARTREDLSRGLGSATGDGEVLAEIVLREHPTGSLRNELGLLRFATAFLREWRRQESRPEVITPGQVELERQDDAGIADIEELRILGSRADPSGSLYQIPEWCEEGQRWQFQLGFLLRFILSGQPDFTRPVRPAPWKESESAYRPAESHWYQRLYGLFSGQPAFGDDWLPITDWVERLLLALLRWPGCRAPEGFDWVEGGIEEAIGRIDSRIRELEQRRGRATGALLMPLLAKRPTATNATRPLRACVVQTVIPAGADFQKGDLALDDRGIRRRHRNHLSAALAAVERMLALRETHKGSEGRLDWLILPELAAHPSDVRTHLIPFARAHRTTVLTGLTYEKLSPGQPLVNSALWIIPEWSDAHGLQIRTRRQGKAHLAPDEQSFNGGTTLLQGFRPCQWLVGYPWSDEDGAQPIWLTASICYDATDLGLAADLRGVSDVLAIPALNKDVKTFDQMALALHYHMFQLIVVANNGQWGGSNAYWPKKQEFIRQVFHTHGQPQASITFFELDDIQGYLQRHGGGAAGAGDWKYPPAGANTSSPGGSL